MQIETLNQKQIIDASGGLLAGLLELWADASTLRFGSAVPVMLGNRRDNASPVSQGILTETVLTSKDGSLVMMIWCDPMELYYDKRIAESGYSSELITEISEMLRTGTAPGKEFDPVKHPDKIEWDGIARQIGRWLLRVRGFKKLRNEDRHFHELESFLNLELMIPPLYALFDEAGYSWKSGEEKRIRDVLEGLKNMDEPSKRIDRVLNCIRLSFIYRYSAEAGIDSTELKETVISRFESFPELIKKISAMADNADPVSPEGNISFRKELVRTFRIPGSWSTVDEVATATV